MNETNDRKQKRGNYIIGFVYNRFFGERGSLSIINLIMSF